MSGILIADGIHHAGVDLFGEHRIEERAPWCITMIARNAEAWATGSSGA